MMVGILGFNDLYLMQYLYKYTRIFDAAGVQYEVIYWNRSNKNDTKGFQGENVSFDYPLNTYLPFRKKVVAFLKYARFMRKQIKCKKYEKLIILTTQTAIPLYDILVRKYAGKYIYDYRDITKEKKFGFYKKMVQNLIKYSFKTAISSEGFLPEIDVLKDEKVLMAHNTQKICEQSEYKAKLSERESIRIVYWGMVRQVEYNKNICDTFGNDSRFTLVYHGDGFYKELEEYCEAKGYKNISFTGRYMTESIPEFIAETDILNCMYENDEIQKCAMPVKAYDAIHYRLPVLVSDHSFVAGYFNGLSGVLALDINDQGVVGDKVYTWYKSLNKKRIEESYAKQEKQVYEDDMQFADTIVCFGTGGNH